MQNAFIRKDASSLQKKKKKSYTDPEIFSLFKSYSTETESSFKVALRSFVSSF